MATFGVTTDNGSTLSGSVDRKLVNSATPGSSGTVTSGSARMSLSVAGTTTAKLLIYADSAGAPGALLAVSDELTLTETTPTWKTANFTGGNAIAITSGTPYWIGVHMKDPGAPSWQIAAQATPADVKIQNDTYADGPADPFGSTSNAAGPMDLYSTYTVAGGDVFVMGLHEIDDGFGPVSAAQLNGVLS